MSEPMAALLGRLDLQTQAIQELADAIRMLAASNQAIVDAVVEQVEDDPDTGDVHYMDGTPVN